MKCLQCINAKNALRDHPSFTSFSATSGLEAYINKSNLFAAGVDSVTRDRLFELTGISPGTFPVRYLGLPLSPKNVIN